MKLECTMNHIPFNTNDHVHVQLTDLGRQIVAAKVGDLNRRLNNPFPGAPQYNFSDCFPSEDSEGWSRWQLWHLMQTFGPHLGNGIPVPFMTSIRVEVDTAAPATPQ